MSGEKKPMEFAIEVKSKDPVSQKSEEMKQDALKPHHDPGPNPELNDKEPKDEVCLFFFFFFCFVLC
jgi:hypothetical protein